MNPENRLSKSDNGGILGGGAILQFATFKMNFELFGINILQVQEIQQPQKVTPVPRAPEHILGLISLRGHIVPLIDLRRRLGMDNTLPFVEPYHIVVRTQYTTASFEVDEIGDVIDVEPDKFFPPPESVRAVDAKFLEGVHPLSNGILSVLNVDRIFETN